LLQAKLQQDVRLRLLKCLKVLKKKKTLALDKGRMPSFKVKWILLVKDNLVEGKYSQNSFFSLKWREKPWPWRKAIAFLQGQESQSSPKTRETSLSLPLMWSWFRLSVILKWNYNKTQNTYKMCSLASEQRKDMHNYWSSKWC